MFWSNDEMHDGYRASQANRASYTNRQPYRTAHGQYKRPLDDDKSCAIWHMSILRLSSHCLGDCGCSRSIDANALPSQYALSLDGR